MRLRPCGLAARHGSGTRSLSAQLGISPTARSRRDGHLARRAVDLAPRQLLPGAPERREDGVRLGLADVGDEVPGRAARLDRPPRAAPPRRAGRGASRTATRRRRSRPRSRRARSASFGSSRSGVPRAITRFPPRCCERVAQVLEALEHEPRAAAGGVAAGEQPVVEHEHRAPRARGRRAPPAAAGDRARAGRAGTRRERSKPSSEVRPRRVDWIDRGSWSGTSRCSRWASSRCRASWSRCTSSRSATRR